MINPENKLLTRKDFEDALYDILNPLQKYYSIGKARINLNSIATVYNESTIGMESFSRIIWGIAPLSVYKENNEYINNIIEGIKNGTNPLHEEYWGECKNYDQMFVEMTPIALALCIIPKKILGNMSEDEINNLEKWLNYINERDVVDNNWLFFRVLVNVALKKVGLKYNEKKIEESLERIESFYLGEGWYSDGKTQQKDYYISFAIQYYSLLYISIEKENDMTRCKKYEERAKLFAKDFIYWFSSNGSSIPYGRSLIYRFAQSAFWGALAFAEIEIFSWGIVKGILLRNMRWWFKQNIFDRDGILNLGYVYPNLAMTESYNSPGSPYWALKSFLPLALSEEHPFWKAEEEELPILDNKKLQEYSNMIIMRDEFGEHIASFVMGQYSQYKLAHCEAKYTKFVYSNIFGFNISKGNMNLEQRSLDSVLSVSLDNELYKVRYDNNKNYICEDYLYTEWNPWENVKINSWIIPGLPWHVRIHKVITDKKLFMIDGGFSIENRKYSTPSIDRKNKETIFSSIINYDNMTSGIINLSKNGIVSTVIPECNTNLLYTRSEVPIIKYEADLGENIFISAVLGDCSGNTINNLLEKCPKVKFVENLIQIKFDNSIINIDVNKRIKFNIDKNNISCSNYIKRVIKIILNYMRQR